MLAAVQGQEEEPCYICGGDPDASIQNPEADLIWPPGVEGPWFGVTCEMVETFALCGFLDTELCILAQNDLIGPRICHCSHLPPEEWLNAYPEDFAYPTITPRPTPAPALATPVPTWKDPGRNSTSTISAGPVAFVAVFGVVCAVAFISGILYCYRQCQRADNLTVATRNSRNDTNPADEVASVCAFLDAGNQGPTSSTMCRTVVLVPPVSVVQISPPMDDHEAPIVDAVCLEQDEHGNKSKQDKKPAVAQAIARDDDDDNSYCRVNV